ncbi:hypothetical protein P7C70_g257, partial [Phenoliferia sp. Uapishka_3]
MAFTDANATEGATPAHHSHLNPQFADTVDSDEGSRGRKGGDYVPSGRGGAGNMSHSRGRQPNPNTVDEDEATLEKARSTSRTRSSSKEAFSRGRGGAGNIRSPSRDPAMRAEVDALNAEERDVQKKYEMEHKDDRMMGGRGGMGNMGMVNHQAGIDAAKEEPITED